MFGRSLVGFRQMGRVGKMRPLVGGYGKVFFNEFKGLRPLSTNIETFEFQAETKNLLDIVAKSLYSDQEVFIRELISNSSDAIEKRRCNQMMQQAKEGTVLGNEELPVFEIKVETDQINNILKITDTGIGMTREDLISCLGTIAKSGSKDFRDVNKEKVSAEQIIGQFGVGFYSAFMVSNKVKVTSRKVGHENGYSWCWDGATAFQVEQVDNLPVGTTIELHLKDGDCSAFSKKARVAEVISKYSYFVTVPIILDGERVNEMDAAIWTLHPKEVTPEMNESFYRQLVKTHHKHLIPERPQYSIHYKSEVPISIRALLYVPSHKVSQLEYAASSADCAVSLYARKVLIKSDASELLPNYLRFLVGVVDSEDVPLNLSREMVQVDQIIFKLRKILTEKIMSFFLKHQKKDRIKYAEFYNGYSLYFKEGLCLEQDQAIKESISKLMLFESSRLKEGETTTLQEYLERMGEKQKAIYYLFTPSRHLALNSPYYEMFKNKGYEVIFIYDPADEIVMLNLPQFNKKQLIAVEKWVKNEGAAEMLKESKSEVKDLEKDEFVKWVKTCLGPLRATAITPSYRVSEHPAMITIDTADLGDARNMLRMGRVKDMEHLQYLKPTLILNMNHQVVRGAMKLKKKDEKLAKLVIEQVFDNALVTAGLMRDSSQMISRINKVMGQLMDAEKSAILTP
uniref:HATPase_c domain-containing protein n=1 Tax=Rhabditophanes sp. KR3021 TaxID=114890 RepID=A0AC35TJ01_9BILA